MIVKQELVKKLKGYFDLNIYETKVWLALLSKGISSAGEIAEISGVPRSRTYDVLESLEKTADEVNRRKKEAESEEAASMGRGKGEEKIAAADAPRSTDNWGRPASTEKTASDRQWLRTFMGSV